MKKNILFFLAVLLYSFLYSQDNLISIHKSKLALVTNDTLRVRYLDSISMDCNDVHPDSGISYILSGLTIAREINYAWGEATCLNQLANLYDITGNYSRALENYVAALKIAEEINNPKLIAACMANMATVYTDHSETVEGLKYYFKALAIAESIHLVKTQVVVLENIGATFYENNLPDSAGQKKNRLDSALVYENRAYKICKSSRDTDDEGWILSVIAIIYDKMNDSSLALKYYYAAIYRSDKSQDEVTLADTYRHMGNFFSKLHKGDSAIKYARLSLKIANENKILSEVVDASSFLSVYYKNAHNGDSAYKYLSICKTASDTLNNIEKIKEVQVIKFNEKVREQDKTEALAKAEEKRKRNLQLLGIGVFILSFIIIVIMLSQAKVPHWIVKSFGVLALLLLFEFISLLIEPLISKWTNDTPYYTLGALVLVAAVLVPTHHTLEHWVKEKLAKRHEHNSKI